MVRLVQQVGRLLRRESDRGRVTIFDRRLASTSYGRQMLEQLPPFKKVVERLV
jgi:ATP-dependent DNA helicase DinG